MSVRSFIVTFVLGTLVVACSGAGEPTGEEETPSSSADPTGYAAQPAQIQVDGDGADWDSLSVRHTDVGDGEGVAIERLWAAHSNRYLFLRVELGQAINLQEDNDLTLYLDTDDDPTTGAQHLGVGAEVTWTFGERQGRFEGDSVGHADIGFSSLPTVRSSTFEIALDRTAHPEGASPIFQNDSLRVALASSGDRLPDDDGGVGYVLTDVESRRVAATLDRPTATDLRVLSQNAVNDFEEGRSAIFKADRQPSYRRIFEAVGPDVIAFQEIYEQTAEETEEVVEGELGVSSEWGWEKKGQDLVLGSRYPISAAHSIPGYEDYESGAFLLDTREALGEQLVVVVMHPPCCNYAADEDSPSRNVQRQYVVDGVLAFLRDVKKGEGPFDVEEGTPIAVVGDMNFVGSAQQPQSLRTGDIVHNDEFGSSAAPDWDGTNLLDTNPQQTGAPLHTTWIDAKSSFPPGRLDYAFVTNSVVEVDHEFVLRTSVLSDEERLRYDLQEEDTKIASDHLPLVIDMSAK